MNSDFNELLKAFNPYRIKYLVIGHAVAQYTEPRYTKVLCESLQRMTNDQTTMPNVAEILAGVLRTIEPKLQPLLLAKLERLAAQRYRTWASDYPQQPLSDGLLACAYREDEIARRVESLVPNASAIQDKLLSEHPELLDLNRTLFEGWPLKVQFAIQAEGERAGVSAWKAYAAAVTDPAVRELFESCSVLEQANADFLQAQL